MRVFMLRHGNLKKRIAGTVRRKRSDAETVWCIVQEPGKRARTEASPDRLGTRGSGFMWGGYRMVARTQQTLSREVGGRRVGKKKRGYDSEYGLSKQQGHCGGGLMS